MTSYIRKRTPAYINSHTTAATSATESTPHLVAPSHKHKMYPGSTSVLTRFWVLDALLVALFSLLAVPLNEQGLNSYMLVVQSLLFLTPLVYLTRKLNQSSISSLLLVRQFALAAIIHFVVHHFAAKALNRFFRTIMTEGDFTFRGQGLEWYNNFQQQYPIVFNKTITFILHQREHVSHWAVREISWLKENASINDYLDVLQMFDLLPNFHILHTLQARSSGILRPKVRTVTSTTTSIYLSSRAIFLVPITELVKFISWRLFQLTYMRSTNPYTRVPTTRALLTGAAITGISICSIRLGSSGHWTFESGVTSWKQLVELFTCLVRVLAIVVATCSTMLYVAKNHAENLLFNARKSMKVVWMTCLIYVWIVEVGIVMVDVVVISNTVRLLTCAGLAAFSAAGAGFVGYGVWNLLEY